MKKRFWEAQIVFALRQAESGTPITEIIRKVEISEVTFYRWKKNYAGMGVSELCRLPCLRRPPRPPQPTPLPTAWCRSGRDRGQDPGQVQDHPSKEPLASS